MRKYLSAYNPSLGELWLIMLALVCLGGSVVTAVAALLLSALVQCSSGLLSLALYPLLFALAIPFIWIRSKTMYHEKTIRGAPISRDASPSFGSMSAVIFFLLLLALTPAFSILIEPLTVWIKMPDFIKDLFGEIGNHGWLSFFSLVIMAPLFEEWLCRGVALNGLLKNGYSPQAAIAWSACMFGVIHLNPWQAIPAFMMGLLFGWIYWRTRSLWAAIFMHAVNNGLSIALTWAFPHLPEDASTYDVVGTPYYYWMVAGALVIVISIILVLHHKLPRHTKS